jgi:regulator of sigma E protease
VGVVVRRKAERRGETPVETTVTVPPVHVMSFGVRMTMLPISAIQRDSIAAKAGFRINDQILKIDGEADFDPMRVPEYIYKHAGRRVVFEIARPSSSGKSETLKLTAEPDDSPPDASFYGLNEPLKIPGLGMAYPVLARVASVAPGSPAAKAGLKPGDEITAMILTPPAAEIKAAPKSKTITLDPKNPSWVAIWKDAQGLNPKTKIQFVVARSKQPIEIQAERDPTWFSSDRGLPLLALSRPLPPQPIGAALTRAWRECCDVAFSLYAMIRGLVQKRLPADQAAGVIRIADIAYQHARAGIDPLTRFLAMLSVNLAVINFLPIPPLDGGQFVFLLAEKIRGRPLPERAQMVLIIAGIVFVLLLFVVVTFNDIMSYFVTN